MMVVPNSSGSFVDYARDYVRDGVVAIRAALTEAHLGLIERAFVRVRDSQPSPIALSAGRISISGYFLDLKEVNDVVYQTPLADIASGVFGGGPVWYIGNQLLAIGGEMSDRTHWHQDSAYAPYSGTKSAVIWVTFNPVVNIENALEVARGSHSGPTYNIFYSSGDRSEASGAYPESEWNAPIIPDIDRDPGQWDLFSTATRRGDVLVFHENAIHGGGTTFPGQTRNTMSFRFVGDDVVYTPRPAMRDKEVERMSKSMQGERFHKAFLGLEPGEPISRSRYIDQVRL